jgi:plastocyanin
MLRPLVLSIVVTAALPAAADTLTGTLDEPALRRKVELVYVEKVDGQKPPTESALVQQRGNTYVPHLIPVVVGQKVVFKSEDPELHNVYARGPKRVVFNDAVLPKMQFEKSFTELGPVHLTCNIHKEMSAWVIVLQNKFWAKPDKSGKFTIDGLPPGSYTIRFWGEGLTDEQLQKTLKLSTGGAS